MLKSSRRAERCAGFFYIHAYQFAQQFGIHILMFIKPTMDTEKNPPAATAAGGFLYAHA
jgi:hypothetical protein